MSRYYPRLPAVILASFALVAVTQGCGDEGASEFGNSQDGGVQGNQDGSKLFNGDDAGGDGTGGPCKGLQCQQVACTGGKKTTVTGKVYDPAMANPLYNAVVYVPNAPVDAFKDGATCDSCAAMATGSPIASAITDASGAFTLENVPVGDNIPIVIQLGKWRRQVVLPKVNSCVDNPISDKNVFRLPKNKTEGDIPKMAIATGGSDPFECLLKKMGVDATEFTAPTQNGRIHYYVAQGGIQLRTNEAPNATTLWSDANTLKKYDIVLLPCEGAEVTNNKPQTSRDGLVDYTKSGGRVFATHYSYTWLATCDGCGADPFRATAAWNTGRKDWGNEPAETTGTIVSTFPKGAAFADWLQNVGATTTKGQLDITEARDDLDTENHPPAQRWLTATTPADKGSKEVVMHYTFNMPVNVPEAQQCGRVVFSDFHVSADAADNKKTFPDSCKTGGMTGQEKALEFMLFDLSSCIQVDDKAPTPPPIIQ